MFGKRPSANETSAPRQAPPPPGDDADVAVRAPRTEQPAPTATIQIQPKAERGKPVAGPKPTPAFEQLRAAQGPAPTTQVVREQSDYYHSTKTVIFNALINTIDLAQLAQLDAKQAAEEIRDIVAELVAI